MAQAVALRVAVAHGQRGVDEQPAQRAAVEQAECAVKVAFLPFRARGGDDVVGERIGRDVEAHHGPCDGNARGIRARAHLQRVPVFDDEFDQLPQRKRDGGPKNHVADHIEDRAEARGNAGASRILRHAHLHLVDLEILMREDLRGRLVRCFLFPLDAHGVLAVHRAGCGHAEQQRDGRGDACEAAAEPAECELHIPAFEVRAAVQVEAEASADVENFHEHHRREPAADGEPEQRGRDAAAHDAHIEQRLEQLRGRSLRHEHERERHERAREEQLVSCAAKQKRRRSAA